MLLSPDFPSAAKFPSNWDSEKQEKPETDERIKCRHVWKKIKQASKNRKMNPTDELRT